MMATNSLKQTVRKTLQCPLCLSFFKEPKILTCSVTFSKGCHETLLESHRNKDVLLCPTCRGKTSLTGVHETTQKNNVNELASEADAKICDVDRYVTFVADQRKWMHNVKEQLKDEIDAAFEESVKKLKERKTVLKNEVEHGQLGELETSLGDMEESGRKQIDQIKTARDLVKNGLSFPIQTEVLTSHKAMCHEMQELLSRIGPDEELPRRTAEEGGRIVFRGEGSDGLQLGQLRQKELKWVLRTDDPLPVGNIMNGMAISPNNEMAVGCQKGGICLYSSEGIIQDPVLSSVKVRALHFMPDGRYVIRDTNNRIFLYSELCEKLDDIKFETMAGARGSYGGLTVGKDGLIFVGYEVDNRIQVFKPEGGKAIREITCNGFIPAQIFAMTSSQAIVFKHFGKEVHVIDDVSGACIHSISKVDENPHPAVCQDDSVIIAWVKHDPGEEASALPTATTQRKEPTKRVVSVLRRQNSEFRMALACTVCFQRKKGVVFECGHSTCKECAELLPECPVCRQPASKVIPLYL
eukprot:XP_011671615.1 PREDICTED: uncharacterized protein LOC105441812 [Strongylocentrotus purpuratus]